MGTSSASPSKSTVDGADTNETPAAVDLRRISIYTVASVFGRGVYRGKYTRCFCGRSEDRSPSVVLNPNNTYHCFICNEHGGPVQAVMRIFNCSHAEALQKLNELFLYHGAPIVAADSLIHQRGEVKETPPEVAAFVESVIDFFHARLMAKPYPAKDYLQRRGLSDQTIRQFRIGWCDESDKDALLRQFSPEKLKEVGFLTPKEKLFFNKRVIFPIFNGDSVHYAIGRALDDQAQPKYIGLMNGAAFKTPFLITPPHPQATVIVEGVIDALAVIQEWRSGAINVLAMLGTGDAAVRHMLERRRNLLKHPVILIPDQDGPGMKAITSLITYLNQSGVKPWLILNGQIHQTPGFQKLNSELLNFNILSTSLNFKDCGDLMRENKLADVMQLASQSAVVKSRASASYTSL